MELVAVYILFDNSALNYISGQPQHGSQLGEADRKSAVDTVRRAVEAGGTVALTNIAALGELAGPYLEDRARFDLVCRFLFRDWAVRVLRPTFDARVQPLRTKMEVLAMGKVPLQHTATCS